jgi:hypothetical protein
MEQSRLRHHSLLCHWSFLEQWHAPEPNAWGRRLVLGIAAPLTRTGCARISTGLRISSSRAAGTTTPTITLSCYRSRKYTLARGLRQSGQPSDHQTRHARSLWAGSGVLILGAGSQSCLGLVDPEKYGDVGVNDASATFRSRGIARFSCFWGGFLAKSEDGATTQPGL